jgi:Lipoate-protein ligase B
VEHLLHPNTLPVYECKRGGSYTYHGPGQRVVYTLLNLKDQDSDIKRFVWNLENWIIKTLENFNIHGYRIEGRTGVWVASDGHNNKCETQAKKIASIGLRLRKCDKRFMVFQSIINQIYHIRRFILELT